eukprot:SAG25_NODE_5406_length_662_cov_1.090586_2_plen_111_part_01
MEEDGVSQTGQIVAGVLGALSFHVYQRLRARAQPSYYAAPSPGAEHGGYTTLDGSAGRAGGQRESPGRAQGRRGRCSGRGGPTASQNLISRMRTYMQEKLQKAQQGDLGAA